MGVVCWSVKTEASFKLALKSEQLPNSQMFHVWMKLVMIIKK